MLSKLKIENEEVLLKFLVLFSRFEYALKRSNFYNKGKKSAEADWPSFIKEIKDSFNTEKSKEIKNASSYLITYPAQEQIIKKGSLDFAIHPSSSEGQEIRKIYNSIRITRNNLFHGGKFPLKPVKDESRNIQLINNCIVMLEYLLTLNQTVESYFWETD